MGNQQTAPGRDIGIFGHPVSLPVACVREHIYYVRAHTHF